MGSTKSKPEGAEEAEDREKARVEEGQRQFQSVSKCATVAHLAHAADHIPPESAQIQLGRY